MQGKRTIGNFERRLRQALSRQGFLLVRRTRTQPGWNLLATRWDMNLPMLIWPRESGRLGQASRADLYARAKTLAATPGGQGTAPVLASRGPKGGFQFRRIILDVGAGPEDRAIFYFSPIEIPAKAAR